MYLVNGAVGETLIILCHLFCSMQNWWQTVYIWIFICILKTRNNRKNDFLGTNSLKNYGLSSYLKVPCTFSNKLHLLFSLNLNSFMFSLCAPMYLVNGVVGETLFVLIILCHWAVSSAVCKTDGSMLHIFRWSKLEIKMCNSNS